MYPNKARFEGNFKNNEKDGEGKARKKDPKPKKAHFTMRMAECIRENSWTESQKEEVNRKSLKKIIRKKGVEAFPGGEKYEGQYKGGRRHGRGKRK